MTATFGFMSKEEFDNVKLEFPVEVGTYRGYTITLRRKVVTYHEIEIDSTYSIPTLVIYATSPHTMWDVEHNTHLNPDKFRANISLLSKIILKLALRSVKRSIDKHCEMVDKKRRDKETRDRDGHTIRGLVDYVSDITNKW